MTVSYYSGSFCPAAELKLQRLVHRRPCAVPLSLLLTGGKDSRDVPEERLRNRQDHGTRSSRKDDLSLREALRGHATGREREPLVRRD